MAGTTKLAVYNQTLRLLGERRIADLNGTEKLKLEMDAVWDDGLIDTCLEQGHWNFATQTVNLIYNSSIQPDFGYNRVFDKPDDWIRTSAISADPYFRQPLVNYSDEGEHWYADIDQIYVKFVSNDATYYGGNLDLWPQYFKNFVAAWLANEVADFSTASAARIDRIAKILEMKGKDARSKDAQNQGVAMKPTGSWYNSRTAGARRYRGE